MTHPSKPRQRARRLEQGQGTAWRGSIIKRTRSGITRCEIAATLNEIDDVAFDGGRDMDLVDL